MEKLKNIIYLKQKKPDAKDYILSDSIYMKCLGKTNLETDQWLPDKGAGSSD